MMNPENVRVIEGSHRIFFPGLRAAEKIMQIRFPDGPQCDPWQTYLTKECWGLSTLSLSYSMGGKHINLSLLLFDRKVIYGGEASDVREKIPVELHAVKISQRFDTYQPLTAGDLPGLCPVAGLLAFPVLPVTGLVTLTSYTTYEASKVKGVTYSLGCCSHEWAAGKPLSETSSLGLARTIESSRFDTLAEFVRLQRAFNHRRDALAHEEELRVRNALSSQNTEYAGDDVWKLLEKKK